MTRRAAQIGARRFKTSVLACEIMSHLLAVAVPILVVLITIKLAFDWLEHRQRKARDILRLRPRLRSQPMPAASAGREETEKENAEGESIPEA